MVIVSWRQVLNTPDLLFDGLYTSSSGAIETILELRSENLSASVAAYRLDGMSKLLLPSAHKITWAPLAPSACNHRQFLCSCSDTNFSFDWAFIPTYTRNPKNVYRLIRLLSLPGNLTVDNGCCDISIGFTLRKGNKLLNV